MNTNNVTREKIAGFMLGVSVGVGIGLFLKPPEETALRAANRRTNYLKEHSDRGIRTDAGRPEENGRTTDP
jgi:hypothetical protein